VIVLKLILVKKMLSDVVSNVITVKVSFLARDRDRERDREREFFLV